MSMIVLGLSGGVASWDGYPEYRSPPGGLGGELLPVSARAFGMGGTCVGIPDTTGVCVLNPAASAWCRRTGVSFEARWVESDDPAWDNESGFPFSSVVMPFSDRVNLLGCLAGRSSVLETAHRSGTDDIGDWRGRFTWDGGLNEGFAGISVRAASWLGLSLGSRFTFGKVRTSATISTETSESLLPVNTEWVDEALFEPAWGMTFGAMIRSGPFSAGLSVTTDRSGTLRLNRDYAGSSSGSLSEVYDIPGEVDVGASVRPLAPLLLSADYHLRKSMSVFDSRVEEGEILGLGAEALVSRSLSLRAGYSAMSGLWRDGAARYTLGGSYVFGGRSCRLDAAYGYETWDESRSEQTLVICLWAGERWL
ncbi:hypothetical protein JW921_05335 [Candidatus Fermentibacterales bacterium]|nr:hypothetical protein [Candidatus Fermentibacterales bacterium]